METLVKDKNISRETLYVTMMMMNEEFTHCNQKKYLKKLKKMSY